MACKEKLYFSLGTQKKLNEDKEITEKILLMILDFCKKCIPETELMICYDDDKGHKKPKITEKSLSKFIEKFRSNKVYLYFTISDYLPGRLYYDYSGEVNSQELEDTFFCNVEFDIRERFGGCNTVDVSVSKELIDRLNGIRHVLRFYGLCR